MNKTEKAEQIRQKLNAVHGIIGDQMSLIEMDIALQKIREVYEEISFLKTGTDNKPGFSSKETANTSYTEQEDNLPEIEVRIIAGDDAPTGEIIVVDVAVEEEKTKIPVAKVPEIELKQEKADVKKDEEDSFELEEETEVRVEKPKKHVEKEIKHPKSHENSPSENNTAVSQGKTVADQFQNTKKSLNDIAGINNKVKDLASKMKDQKIDDLKTAINLNERFLFTKDLFAGNAEKYGKAIEDLNSVKDLDEAMEYLNSNFSWDMEKDSFKKFLELVYRRHIPVK